MIWRLSLALAMCAGLLGVGYYLGYTHERPEPACHPLLVEVGHETTTQVVHVPATAQAPAATKRVTVDNPVVHVVQLDGDKSPGSAAPAEPVSAFLPKPDREWGLSLGVTYPVHGTTDWRDMQAVGTAQIGSTPVEAIGTVNAHGEVTVGLGWRF